MSFDSLPLMDTAEIPPAGHSLFKLLVSLLSLSWGDLDVYLIVFKYQ